MVVLCFHILQDSISTIVTGIRAALKERISEKDWLDSTTKQRALNKVDNIIDFLVYPDIIYDNDKLNEIYSSVSVQRVKHPQTQTSRNYFSHDYTVGSVC